MMGTEHEKEPAQIDPLTYLAEMNGDCSPSDLFEHYQVLRPALYRLHHEGSPAFDVALREVTKRLKIKALTVERDLARLTPPPRPPPMTSSE